MDKTIELYFEPGQSVERLDRFLSHELPEMSRSQLKKLVDQQQIVVNGEAVKAGLRLRGGEKVLVVIPPAEEIEAVAEQIPIEVLYEDSDLIVINKAAGMVVHPACGHASGTLVNALLHHCQDLSGIGGELRPGIVHRLDMDTSGVMVATKNDMSHAGLAAQFKAHTVNRRYVALVHGIIDENRGTVDQPIGRHPTLRKKMSSQCRNGRHAVTHWKVLRRYESDRLTLVELRLETGRTHQIRVHFSELNLPIIGDPLYGNRSRANGMNDSEIRQQIQHLKRQALHARLLGFIHPRSGEYMQFTSPIPDDIASILCVLDEKYDIEPLSFSHVSLNDENHV